MPGTEQEITAKCNGAATAIAAWLGLPVNPETTKSKYSREYSVVSPTERRLLTLVLTVLEDGRVVFGGCGWTFVTDHEDEIRRLLAELRSGPSQSQPAQM